MSVDWKIVLCDDDENRPKVWKSKLLKIGVGKSFEINALSLTDLVDAMNRLEKRQRAARAGENPFEEENLFDTADVLVFDFDLENLPESAAYATGGRLAYLARVFSGAKFIVVLNHPELGLNTFDLSLTADARMPADLYIGSDQLANPGLWMTSFKGYRPWHWPLIPAAVKSFEARVNEIKGDPGILDQSLAEYFGFTDPKIFDALPRSVLQYIQAVDEKDSSVAKTKFREFLLHSGRAIERRDAEKLKDNLEVLVRAAAAWGHRWLERLVLPNQDVLVDAPHLIERMPFLLSGDAKKPEAWDVVADLGSASGLKPEVQQYRFNHHNWISRPVFWWGALQDDDAIREMFSEWSGEAADVVFREDVSNFGRREKSRQFVAELGSIYDRRYVSDPQKERLGSGPSDNSRVVYSPSSRFAL